MRWRASFPCGIFPEELSRDPVKTILVDMTRLGLVEITRKKVRRPLHEIL